MSKCKWWLEDGKWHYYFITYIDGVIKYYRDDVFICEEMEGGAE